MRKFIINNYGITSDKLGSEWNNTKIVMLSDLHDNFYGIDLNEVYQRILMIRPDFIVIAGDMLNGEPGCKNKNAEDFLKKIGSKFDIYYGLGNHEYRMMLYPGKYPGMYAQFERLIRESGIHLLKNQSVELKKGGSALKINGLMIDHTFYKKFKRTLMTADYMEETLGKADEDAFNILIAHHPIYFQNYADWGADLVFSGHVHGGMARIPYVGGVIAPNYRLFPKYDMGRFQIDDSVMILSSGIGTHTINLRPFNPPEMVAVTLNVL